MPRKFNLPAGFPARLALFTALLFCAAIATVFLLPADCLIGAFYTDICKQFLAWRAFAAANLRAGHLPLWNPYTFSGQPFLGEFQSALFYPPNLVFLCLPLCRAMNLSVVAHFFFLGWGMYRFASRRGLSPLGAGLCAYLLPFSGAVFPHLYAGHLSNLCTMAWTPWIFASLEDWVRGGKPSALLVASAEIALQILAGHPQYVFYTAFAVGTYALACSILNPPVRRRALPAVALVYAAAAVLAAIQLFPGFAAVSEGVRQGRIDFTWASSFSFPVENLLTLIAPAFFGTLNPFFYWGRCDLWEVTAFVGVSGIVLAGAAVWDREHRRGARLDLGLTAFFLLIALGQHTPLYRFLYDTVPGFDHFRGASKFVFPALIFLVLAVGRGGDAVMQKRIPRRLFSACAMLAGAGLIVTGLVLRVHPEPVADLIRTIQHSGESFVPPEIYVDGSFMHDAEMQAGGTLIVAGGIFILAGGSLLWARRRPFLRWAPLLLLAWEVCVFTRTSFVVSHYADAAPDLALKFVAEHPGDYRIFNIPAPNNGYLLGRSDISGVDPEPLKRYAEFITFTQGGDPNKTTQDLSIHTFPLIFTMLRFNYLFHVGDSGALEVATFGKDPMARVQLLSDYRVLPGRDAIFSTLLRPDFDPRRTVLLESEPKPRPEPSEPGGNSGSVRVVESSTDSLTIEAQVLRPTLLLITDPYSRDWHARPLPGSVQDHYDILPANYVLRAVPLTAGHHLIRMEYLPSGFRLGIAVSILAWLLWLGAVFRLRALTSRDSCSNP